MKLMKQRMSGWVAFCMALCLSAVTSQARWLNPATGRFQTMDSYEGARSEPLSLQKYAYTAGNPVNLVDPSGHEGEAISTTGAAGLWSALGARMSYAVFKAVHYAARFPKITKVVLGGQTLMTWWGISQNPEEAALYWETGGLAADLALLKSIAKDVRGIVAMYKGINSAKQAQRAVAILTERALVGGTEVPRSGFHDPPGWNLLKDGERQRGHLLANCLGGQGDVPENVVTLYRAANREMETYELRVLDAVKKGEKVEYAATAIYSEGQIFPSAINIFAQGNKGFSLDVTIPNLPR